MHSMAAWFAAIIVCAVAANGFAQEWTRFRGPNGTGISQAKTIPTVWTDKDFNWKVSLPGVGHSSPVLWGEKIFVTSADETASKFFVMCVGARDGRILWQRDFPFARYHKHDYNSFASASAAADEQRVYVCKAEKERYTLVALDHEGKTVWEKDLGPFESQHGAGTSPIVYKDEVIMADEQDGESFVLAADAATGKTRWKTARKTAQTVYSTPCVYQPKGGQPNLVFNSQAHGISALSPESGKVVWEFAEAFDKRTVSSPVIAGDLIIGSCGSGGGGNYVVAVRPGEPAKDKKAEAAYTIRKAAPYVPTSVFVGGLLFLWGDGGIVTCVQAGSGAIKWQERVEGNFFGSPVWVDGRLFCASTRGDVFVIEASDQFKVLGKNTLGEQTHSTPAVAAGKMYVHTSRHLVSVGGREKPEIRKAKPERAAQAKGAEKSVAQWDRGD